MTITIHIDIEQKKHVPLRRHVHFPASDQITQDWFDQQSDQSAAVRLLIADEVRQHGNVDRVLREKFGTVAAQHAAGLIVPVPVPAAPTLSPAAAATAGPAPWNVPGVDAKDAQIAFLTETIARRDAEITSLRKVAGPIATLRAEFQAEAARLDEEERAAMFRADLERDGITQDGLLV